MRTVDFLRWGRYFHVLSGALLLIALSSLVVKGLSYGLDFTGGLSIELEFPHTASLPQIRQRLQAAGIEDAQVSYFGSDRLVVIRTAPTGPEQDGQSANAEQITATVVAALDTAAAADSGEGRLILRRSESVGPRVGNELREQGGLAMLVALMALLVYVSLRFQLKFAVAAVAALVHDVVLVLGMFSLFELDFDLAVLTAVLALLGYSLNDTIVVSDRIRENFRRLKGHAPRSVINISLTQTLARTLVTSITTLIVLLCLLFFGGGALMGFSLALALGVMVGTYSSVYIVTGALLQLRISSDDLAVPEREDDNSISLTGDP